jgi:hypothetical protein
MKLQPIAGKLRGKVYRRGGVVVIAHFKDYALVTEALKGMDVKVRAVKHGTSVAGTQKILKSRRLSAQTPLRRGNFKDGNPGVIRLPEGVSREPWPAAWIRRSETEAIESSDPPPWEIRP